MPRTRGPHLLSWPTDVCRPLSSPPLTDAPSDGPAVISWIEHHCVYGEGDHWGEPVRLEVFEKLFLIWLFERRPDGRRRYRRALLEVPKGNGKTGLAAWIGVHVGHPTQRGDPGRRVPPAAGGDRVGVGHQSDCIFPIAGDQALYSHTLPFHRAHVIKMRTSFRGWGK